MFTGSRNIDIFPLSKNRATGQNSRSLSEDRIANIIRQVVDADGFVISDSVSSSPFEFNLYGYFISVQDIGAILDEFSDGATEIWASIALDSNKEIAGQDDNNLYTGVEFSATKPVDGSSSLLILSNVDGSWSVPEMSTYRLSTDKINLRITRISGKH